MKESVDILHEIFDRIEKKEIDNMKIIITDEIN